MKEIEIVNDIRLACSKANVRLFRNNVGVLQDARGQFVAYGLAIGSSDLIGYKSITVTADMVGKPVAIFAAIEVKRENEKATEAQSSFLLTVKNAGGIAGVAHSVREAKQILGLKT